MAKYIDIQNEVVKKYRVDLCDGTRCSDGDWSRTHAHVKQRRVCKWKQTNSVQSTFELFHEIGHLETTKSGMRRCEEEFYATKWAIAMMDKYGLAIPEKVIKDYQEYIDMEWGRGKSRGGVLPSLKSFRLDVLTEDEAKERYCHGKSVYYERGGASVRKMTPSWDYGSHAPCEVLFYRTIEQSGGRKGLIFCRKFGKEDK